MSGLFKAENYGFGLYRTPEDTHEITAVEHFLLLQHNLHKFMEVEDVEFFTLFSEFLEIFS